MDEVNEVVSQTEETQPKLPCKQCETFWGIVGIAFGGVIFLIGVDFITHGKISRMLIGGSSGT